LREGKLRRGFDSARRGLWSKLPVETGIEAYNVDSSTIPPRDCAHGDLGLLRLSRSEFLAAFRLFLDRRALLRRVLVADGVLTLG